MGNIYAVAGNPILASRSPRMFNAAFRELSLDAVYTRLAVTTAEEVITTAREAGIDGLNITSPFKAGGRSTAVGDTLQSPLPFPT